MGEFYKAAAAPRWAIRRAIQETRDYNPRWFGSTDAIANMPHSYPAVTALARYIAKHEKAPTDPLTEALLALNDDVTQGYVELLRAELAQRGIKIERMDQ